LTRFRTLIAVLAIAVPIPAAVAGCGGGGGGNDEDPAQVLDQTFNNSTKVTSGHLAIDLSGSAEGTQSGSLNATIEGPFQSDSGNPDRFPQLDLTAKVSASGAGQSFNFDGSLITTKDNAYVEYQGQAYEIGTALYQQFLQSYKQAQKQAQAQGNQDSESLFKQFGIDPTSWLTNLSNEGTTDVDGTDTIHIQGDANVPQIVSDVQKIVQQSGDGQASLPQSQIDQLESAIKTASIDVYSGTSDKLLRKLDLSLAIEPPEGTDSQVSSVDANFSVTLSDVNETQTISAPSGAKPLTDLLGQFGINLPPGVLGGSAGAPSDLSVPGVGGSAQAYTDCLKNATTPADLQECAQKAQ
jgi:hypothetical protein